MKFEKGITLIALIITIVVLLILAVVAISAVQESDIIMHAEKAVEEHEKGKEKELITLAYSEYFMSKRTNPNATFEVEGATVTGSEDNGWEVTFDKTNNAYEVDKDGKISVAGEMIINEEKDIGGISYIYRTQYNPNQPEIISFAGYYDDKNQDGMIDDNPEKAANIYWSVFNIKNTLFEGVKLSGGNIEAKITHLDGSVEDITFTTIDYKAWKYEAESPLESPDKLYIEFRPNTKALGVFNGQYTGSAEYHYLYIEGEVLVPFQKLEVLGKTLEFPVTCEVCFGICSNPFEIYPMYKDISNVNKIIINFSDGTKKVYLKEQFETELEFEEGIIVSLLPVLGIQLPVTSVIVEEDGVATKYNVTDNTRVSHARPGT